MQDQQTMRLDNLALMRRLGYGPEVMKEIKVCRICGCSCTVREKYCRDCGAVLPRETLFDLYKGWHLYCPACETVVASTTVFCPECGKRLRHKRIFGWRKAE